VPRANGRLEPSDVARAAGAIEEAAVLLLQLETPLETAISAARLARGAGRTVVLNPAPVPPPAAGREGADLAELLRLTDVLVPNETEARQLTGVAAGTSEGAVRAGRALVDAGSRAVVITLGARGALLVGAGREEPVPPFDVHVVDTTAAGDAFCGALAVALAEGQSLPAAASFASAAGALAVTVAGAGPSLPRRQEIERLLSSRG
jgi:ribokinase